MHLAIQLAGLSHKTPNTLHVDGYVRERERERETAHIVKTVTDIEQTHYTETLQILYYM